MLRAHACVICGDPIPAGRRLDRRYCKVSCRSVAYRARKGGQPAVTATGLTEPEADLRPSRYGRIPREVLDILAKHFGAHDEGIRAELAVAQKRAEQLQQALEAATAPPHPGAEESQSTRLAAQERIRKLTEALERSQAESADKYDKLASKYETLSRQKQAATEEQTQNEDALKAVQAELQAAQAQLAQAAKRAEAQDQQLSELQLAVETGKDRASQLDVRATTAEDQGTELQQKCKAAESQASRDADQLRAQTAQIAKLEAKLSAADGQGQAPLTRGVARGGEYESLQQQIRALQARVKTEDAAVRQQLAALEAERDQLQAECSLHRERTEQEAADSTYDRVSAVGVQMLRRLLEDQHWAEPAALQEHMQRFRALIDWSSRWFVRQFVCALLQSETQVRVDEWAKQAASNLITESKQALSQVVYGLAQWAQDNPVLLGQLALCVAASTAARVLGAVPAPFRAALNTSSAQYTIPDAAVMPPSDPALFAAPPRPAPALAQPLRRAQVVTPPKPPPELEQSATWSGMDHDPEPLAVATPPSSPKPFALDRLVSIKLDLLSVSHQLAELQDIMGRPITSQRVREGTSIGEQAVQESMADRWNYISRPPSGRKTPVYWIRVGELLDDQSEHELRDRTTEQFVDVSARLRILEAKRRRR